VPEAPSVPPTFGFTYSVLLPLLVYLPVFIAGSVAADAITEELDAGTFELLRVSPLSAVEVVEGKMLAMIALVPAQAGAWLLLLRLNGTRIEQPLAILVLVTAAATVVVALGSGVALRLRDRQSTQLVYSLGVIVLFAAASAVPESPPNAVAKLAVGSHGPATLAMVAGYAAAAGLAVWLVRRSVAAGPT
jgi:ABC-type Na+ efflux pump permease subunit